MRKALTKDIHSRGEGPFGVKRIKRNSSLAGGGPPRRSKVVKSAYPSLGQAAHGADSINHQSRRQGAFVERKGRNERNVKRRGRVPLAAGWNESFKRGSRALSVAWNESAPRGRYLEYGVLAGRKAHVDTPGSPPCISYFLKKRRQSGIRAFSQGARIAMAEIVTAWARRPVRNGRNRPRRERSSPRDAAIVTAPRSPRACPIHSMRMTIISAIGK